MTKGLTIIIGTLFFLVIGITPLAWGEARQVTIIYSNNINGQIYPAG